MKVITKYKNRRMYLEGVGPVNLSDIINMIKKNEEVKVETSQGEDVTEEVLKQALSLIKMNKFEIMNMIKTNPSNGEKYE